MSLLFNFKQLNAHTREVMETEIKKAINSGNLYESKRFNQTGKEQWPNLILEAARSYNEGWLAYELERMHAMNEFEGRTLQKGGYTVAHVPHTAAKTLADGQFNRFYIMAICVIVKEKDLSSVTVYRAKAREEHRSSSDSLIGNKLDANQLYNELAVLKSSFDCAVLKPNSGLSVEY
jgi:hypothetical protein